MNNKIKLGYSMITLVIGLITSSCANFAEQANSHVINSEAYYVEDWNLTTATFNKQLNIAVEGQPLVIDTPVGTALQFDGNDDRLVVENNPIIDAKEFTIEAIVHPNNAYPLNNAPRFLHIESPENPDRRVTMEMRLNQHQEWYLDAFIKSEDGKLTLVNETLVHPVNQWFHVAITYKNQQFTTYVNGNKELEGIITYKPIAKSAQTSIGARLNSIHWFDGAIAKIRFTHKAIDPTEFINH
ncbi:hypothetical protein C2869_22040 (plasmid) [Saccharobesus litoralis]|uniref:Concanavalin A-like lectin/glucanases superfamily protein n=1 Tax=Saccharobesus litoralis TaxID=2172099 RepID=A0A2S0VYD2_9ALTE|nr:LamG domain-containing protein [Saccharobesus litoralis]AWB69185.1 hypothetical protein C2869_22040 [Saccharobesus litoralis]